MLLLSHHVLVAKGHTLELPAKVPVYFTGKDGYEVKDLAVEWDEVPAENLANAGEFKVRGRVLGTDLTAEVAVRVTDKLGENYQTTQTSMTIATVHLLLQQ